MKITFLIDNKTKDELIAEWGLSIFIEYNSKKILLDTGASNRFLENARHLKIDLSEVDFGVLSHAHFDHADGMEGFFDVNSKAPFYIVKNSSENCFEKHGLYYSYIGIKQGTLYRFNDRLKEIEGLTCLTDGVYLLPHLNPHQKIGEKNNMVVYAKNGWQPDNFSHEQSLIFKTTEGLVVFNSCSHIGVDAIIDEIKAVFPKEKIYAYIGGFHLYNTSETEVLDLANRLKQFGIKHIYSGHCTGGRALSLLKKELGECFNSFYSGLVLTF